MPDDLARRLRDQGLQPTGWANGPGDRYGAHDHHYDKVIVVEHGSIRFGLPATHGRDEPRRARRIGRSCLPGGASPRRLARRTHSTSFRYVVMVDRIERGPLADLVG
jgi:predicted metal-dependent enzyme (double-stranded beta helix superfamily)